MHDAQRPDAPTSAPFDPLLAYETVLSDSRLLITVFDRDLVVRSISRAAAELLGMSREEAVGRPLRGWLPAEYIAADERVLAGETIEIEERISAALDARRPWTHALLLPVHDAGGVVQGGLVVVFDVSESMEADALAERLTYFDPITRLPNRRLLTRTIDRLLSGAKGPSREFALVCVNIDRFKDVNDALGQEAGDGLLREVGERLQNAVRASDLVAHIGGDEFIVMLPRAGKARRLERLLARLRELFRTPFVIGGEAVLVSTSSGVVVHPGGGDDARELQENAHTAMRAAKAHGGGGCEFFQSGLTEGAERRMRLVGEIDAGMREGQFVLHYQPQIHLASMRVQAVEALVRWQHPERGLLAPGEFIDFAEETGMIVPLGRYVLERACRDHAGWREHLEAPPRLALNISAREFQRSDVCGQVREVAEAAGLSPSALEIEITETAVLADQGHAAAVATCLHEAGASIALDDFGTGYSSLTHLRELPIDRVKIDQTFVASCLTDRSAAAILVAVTRLAHDLGMEVVAEGVETQAQLDFLRAVGCDAAQGYHLARPLLPEECVPFLARRCEISAPRGDIRGGE